jgi:hypothetical protein
MKVKIGSYELRKLPSSTPIHKSYRGYNPDNPEQKYTGESIY